MRIAFVFPNYFPYVRRGAERVMVEYAQYLARAGHTVDVITSKPGGRRVVREDNLTVYYEPQLNHPVLARRWTLFRFYSFSLTALQHLMRRSYDVAHIWLYTYGLPVRLARRVRGTPYLYHQMQEVTIVPRRVDRWLFRHVVLPADRVATLTAPFAAEMEKQFGIPVEVLPPCVDMETFIPAPDRDLSRPRVFFASDMTDPFKGAALLLRAWNEIHRCCPEAVLTFGGPGGQVGIPSIRFGAEGDPLFIPGTDFRQMLAELVPDPAARAAVEVIGVGRVRDLPGRYAHAAVTVLPSVWEGFGLVLLESLACGTPVVGNAFGGPGHIISDPRIGATLPLPGPRALTEPNRAGELAEAVLHAIDLARDPATAERCRTHARQWSREVVGREVERVYADMVGARTRETRRAGA